MQINEIVQKLNMTARAIRFYEEKGLISPQKQAINQYRVFTEQEVWRLQTIIALREVGMNLEDIKSALEQMEGGDYDELQYYLELQRSMMFSQWLEYKQMIATTDGLIDLLKQEKSLPLSGIYELAEGSKRLRNVRKNWRDQWDYDGRAVTHDQVVANLDEDRDPEYKDYAEALSSVAETISPQTGEVGLDLGTGTGNLAGQFLASGITMCGVDQSKEMLRQCRLKFPHMETKLGNFLAIPYLDDQFDFVVSSFAFHHLTNEQKQLSLQEMERVLKPNGRLCLADLIYSEAENEIKPAAGAGKFYASLADLLTWFDQHGFMVQYKQINSLLHIIHAIKA
ncbi:methyltransferase domain-containing protein [Paenibacillus psychroresistens]|uniref:Methyltransferase domain-containing protein n=1 Tax=Paenibacillus psychroresistens TaxID=1778678 RepID=A0A6B8RPE6_9BACL|nr:methyltransferase domain-containing protein [Paenibacillus psychroresistens]QGQ97373.1 methyltransferase domain-containing protein [Paenibacillus psychroresistens]